MRGEMNSRTEGSTGKWKAWQKEGKERHGKKREGKGTEEGKEMGEGEGRQWSLLINSNSAYAFHFNYM